MTPRTTSPPSAIILGVPSVEFVERSNDCLGETGAFFDHLMPPLEHERGVTFYGHAKGASKSTQDLTWVIPWCKRMYDSNLSEAAVAALKSAPCVGIYRNRRTVNISPDLEACPWHFPGTFFWFRNERVFQHPSVPWRQHPESRFAVEMYLGYRFGVDEGCCLWGEGQSTI